MKKRLILALSIITLSACSASQVRYKDLTTSQCIPTPDASTSAQTADFHINCGEVRMEVYCQNEHKKTWTCFFHRTDGKYLSPPIEDMKLGSRGRFSNMTHVSETELEVIMRVPRGTISQRERH